MKIASRSARCRGAELSEGWGAGWGLSTIQPEPSHFFSGVDFLSGRAEARVLAKYRGPQIAADVTARHLQRDRAVQLGVGRLVDDPIPPLPSWLTIA